MSRNFAAFILTHGRPDNVITYKTIREGGYTGPIYLVVDNEDKTVDEYRKRYGDKVIMFDKKAISETFDTGDLSQDRRTIVFARNACFDIAKDLGVTHFIQLDDDYTGMMYRFEKDGKLGHARIKDLDTTWKNMVDFLETSGAKTVAMSQGGDHIGGLNGMAWKRKILRKAMNSFVCRTDNPINFIGRINEDVNVYTTKSTRGELYFTICDVMLTQKETQSNNGGMTDIYLDSGTYLKSFFSVMMCPSAVTVELMNSSNARLHHRVNWGAVAPKIMSDKWRKPRAETLTPRTLTTAANKEVSN